MTYKSLLQASWSVLKHTETIFQMLRNSSENYNINNIPKCRHWQNTPPFIFLSFLCSFIIIDFFHSTGMISPFHARLNMTSRNLLQVQGSTFKLIKYQLPQFISCREIYVNRIVRADIVEQGDSLFLLISRYCFLSVIKVPFLILKQKYYIKDV